MSKKNSGTIKVENMVGERLDLFLALTVPETSRAAFKKSIESNLVKVNGDVEFRANYKVRRNDVIEYELEERWDDEKFEIKKEDIPLDILYEDSDLLVINKPSGTVAHPATGNWQGTIMNAVLYHFQDLGQVGSKIRSGLIHRLDKDTSGVMLIAKSNKGLWYYTNLFAERKVSKTYLAVCRGDARQMFGNKSDLRVENYLGRKTSDRKKRSQVEAHQGRLAVTEFSVVETVQLSKHAVSIVSAKPLTGRTHQIRVHLSGLGLPILGDVIYGKNNSYKRLMLHAWKLKLVLLNGKECEFIAPLPNEFKEFVNEDKIATKHNY